MVMRANHAIAHVRQLPNIRSILQCQEADDWGPYRSIKSNHILSTIREVNVSHRLRSIRSPLTAQIRLFTGNPGMAYTNSRRWESPETQAKNAYNRKAIARKRFFKANHKKLEWILPQDHLQETLHHSQVEVAKRAFLDRKQGDAEHIAILPFRGKVSFHDTPSPDMRHLIRDQYPELELAMSRFTKINLSLRSSVLAQPTIWVHQNNLDFGANKRTISSQSGFYCEKWPNDSDYTSLCVNDQVEDAYVAEWPCAQECKFEGDDRIATDLKHSRFFPVPRKPGNSTVNWQQLSFLDQHDFDQVHCGGSQKKPTEEDALFMDLEVGFDGQKEEHVGNRLLGEELMGMLDPQGIYAVEEDFHAR